MRHELRNRRGVNTWDILISPEIDDQALDRVRRKEWVILRLLLFGDTRVRVYKNRVQFEDGGTDDAKSDIKRPGLISIENENRAIIPNIFNYREHVYDASQIFPKNLFKIRAIQYLLLQPEKKAGVLEILHWYQERFDYPFIDLRFEIREMIYNSILSPERLESSVISWEIVNGNYPISLTGLGKLIFNDLIKRSILYEVVRDDTPIQRQFAHNMTPYARFDKDITWNEYMIMSTKEIILFILYLKAVEEAEEQRYNEAKQKKSSIVNKTPPWEDYKDYLEIFTKSTVESIKSDIRGRLYGFIWARRNRGKRWLRVFIEDWLNAFEVPITNRKFDWTL